MTVLESSQASFETKSERRVETRSNSASEGADVGQFPCAILSFPVLVLNNSAIDKLRGEGGREEKRNELQTAWDETLLSLAVNRVLFPDDLGVEELETKTVSR